MKVLLLGVGLQGKAALYDLATSPLVSHVIAADVDLTGVRPLLERLPADRVTAVQMDVRQPNLLETYLQQVDAVVALLPKTLRLEVAPRVIHSGVHFVETSYALPEYQALGEEAAARGVTLLPEFGLDPGIDLVLAGRAVRELDEVHELHVYGTGVPEPKAANNPLKYKISWTFAGVLSAYQRPARMMQDGQIVELTPAQMFSPEYVRLMDVEGIGRMEAYYNGDAVRYLDVFGVRDTVRSTGRYTLRWPGHSAFWKVLVELGFLNEEPIEVAGTPVVPRQFVHDLLAPQLQYAPDERDIAAIRVEAVGLKDGRQKRIVYQMVDYRDLETGFLAMQRTVGFTASIGAQMILRGDIQKRGLLAPGRDVPSDVLIAELQKRGIEVKRWEDEV
ncbi:MAG: hypothetical protein D6803_06480 [Anaerolineae bacterium]|nr:MAG: hypothetical protein D6803_06480 [Anaerolineae bacterium]